MLPPDEQKKGGCWNMAEISEFEAKKRQLIKKKRRNRLKRRFIVFMFLFICMAIIFTVLKAPFFNVKTIICVGQQELTEEQVIKIAGAKTNVNIFSTSVKTMKRNLSENPAVAECNVRRLFPNKIKIWVRESKAVAYAESGGLFLLTDKNGQIIKVFDAKEPDSVKGIARLENFKPEATELGKYIKKKDDPVHNKVFECIEILDKLQLIDNVTMISASDLSDIRIDYKDSLYIMLGSYEQMEYKLTFIKKVISENLSEYEKAILDYRGKSLYVGPRVEETAENDSKQDESQEGQATPESADSPGTEETKTAEQQSADGETN
jgi:cell division septal protein FtsQ